MTQEVHLWPLASALVLRLSLRAPQKCKTVLGSPPYAAPYRPDLFRKLYDEPADGFHHRRLFLGERGGAQTVCPGGQSDKILGQIANGCNSFDALTMVASTYSYKALPSGAEPHRNVKLFWAVLLMLLPIALIFSENLKRMFSLCHFLFLIQIQLGILKKASHNQ